MANKLTREFELPLTVATKPKPRCWSFLETETGGTYKVFLEGPDKKQSVLAEISVTVPVGKVATVSVRTSVGLADKPKPVPVEVGL